MSEFVKNIQIGDKNYIVKDEEARNNILAIQEKIDSVSSGSPKGSYETVEALQNANPETGVYIVTGNGHAYSWTKNGTSAIDLGAYQSSSYYNGNIINLGYTTFEACKKDGYYSFSTANLSSISDKPANLTSGGVLRVEKNAALNVVYQTICNNEGDIWFRHSSVPFTQISGRDLMAKEMSYQGNIIDLGFTTFASCKNNGYYNFSSANVLAITDKPANLTCGGVLRVEKNAGLNVVYQTICNNEGDIWFRYHISEPFKQLINANQLKYTGKMIILGDSIAQGYFSYLNDLGEPTLALNYQDSWLEKFRKMSAYDITNSAVGGSGYVCRGTVLDKLTGREHIENIDFSNYDMALLCWGINDWKANYPKGSMNDSLSTGGTFYSNMRYVIEKIIANNPYCKIIVVTPLNACLVGTEETNWGLGYSYSNSGTLEDIFNAMVEICEYYGIEYIDLTHNSVINRKNIKTLLPDNVHPTLEAHNLIAQDIMKKINF